VTVSDPGRRNNKVVLIPRGKGKIGETVWGLRKENFQSGETPNVSKRLKGEKRMVTGGKILGKCWNKRVRGSL